MQLERILANVPQLPQRLFGVEIEVNNINQNRAASVLNAAGIQARSESYNHTRRSWWKVTTDGSLSGGAQNACEIVSPPLPFNVESLKLVAAVIRTLRAEGATVDNTCGLHVHVDARDLTRSMEDFSRIIFLRYRESEEIIDQMVAANRRTSSNTFCKTMKHLTRNSRFGNLQYDRYQKLNFNSFPRHGTIEFRQHEGCLDDAKVVSWIIFCSAFFESTRLYYLEHGAEEISQAQSWA